MNVLSTIHIILIFEELTLEHLLMIRPSGVVSKKAMGARSRR